MNNFRNLLPAAILVFVLSLFGAGIASVLADWLHPRMPCLGSETNYWGDNPPGTTFERVSSHYWSSLCRRKPVPLVISASEGTGDPSFPEILQDRWKIGADQFTGAHRGLKTFGYLFGNEIHPERLKDMRILAFMNPVYFSFAASTDAASIRLNAISNLSYLLRVPSLIQKWDEFLLDSFYISARDYYDELRRFRAPPEGKSWPSTTQTIAPPEDQFDRQRNMLIERAHVFKSYDSRFRSSEQPSRRLYDITLKFMNEHPNVPVCLVLLPTNTMNLEFFGRDAKAIVDDLNEMFSRVPRDRGVNLQSLNEEPKIFLDPMHLTAYGKARVLEEVMKTDCAKKVFEQ